jgi:ATP/ADP translocase
MSTRIVMIASALVMAILGITATFLPQEALGWLGIHADGVLPLVVQLTGALYLSFAMLNWTAKESLLGGIYNRPIALGNFLHFVMGALALGKGVFADPSARVLMPLAIAYGLLALAFAKILFTSPVRDAQQQS